MAIEGILDREGYNEPTLLLPGRAYDMARCILSLGGQGNISPAIVPTLLVHLFAVVEPDAEDRDHHRGALMFLAHQGGFTAMPSAVMRGGEEMRLSPEPRQPPDWATDHRFIEVMFDMQNALRASIGVSDNGEETALIIHLSDEDLANDSHRQVVLAWGPKVRATIAAIRGSDPGYVEIKFAKHWDPLKAKGIDAATPVSQAEPVDKVIVDTRDLRSGDIIRLWQTRPGEKNPIKPLPAEEFKVRWLCIQSSANGEFYIEKLDLMSLGINRANPDGNGAGYQFDARGYRWEVIERPTPPEVAQAAAEHHPV